MYYIYSSIYLRRRYSIHTFCISTFVEGEPY